MQTRPVPARIAKRLGSIVSLLCVSFVLFLAQPVQAHSSLISSEPAAGANVTGEIKEVRLTFSEGVQPEYGSLSVLSPSGQPVMAGSAVNEGNVVIQPLIALTEVGTYAVGYRIVSSDGHPVSNKLEFTVNEVATTSSSTTAVVSTSSAPTTLEPSGPAAESSENTPWVLTVLATCGVLALVAALTFAWRRHQ